MQDSYLTLSKPSPEVLYKEKGSKFFGYAFPVSSEEDVQKELDQLRRTHHTARHHCYAWVLGPDSSSFRANDDGEPANSSGAPILGQIRALELTEVLVVVVRYFGGTKLGVGGLMQAYKQSAALALEDSTIIEKKLQAHIALSFNYSDLSEAERLIRKFDLQVIHRQMEASCRLVLQVPLSETQKVMQLFEPLHRIRISVMDQEE